MIEWRVNWAILYDVVVLVQLEAPRIVHPTRIRHLLIGLVPEIAKESQSHVGSLCTSIADIGRPDGRTGRLLMMLGV